MKDNNVQIISIAKGYASKCNSSTGLCIDPLGIQYMNDSKSKQGEFSNHKPKTKCYFTVVLTTYINDKNQFQKSEYYSPTGQLVYTNTCPATNEKCSNMEYKKVVELLNQLKKNMKPVKKVVKKCKCK
jgi:hypothetical protein